ncbi:hypothetical protein [uncultured Tateyamaria sp.]|uniref:hypothetical protein n=1 Tax=uncultured Tateyamaria sp. TaxID=455651 RepID=UPI002625EF08|nr:hypothetical protein [uncultured Tateyamaria sp.]
MRAAAALLCFSLAACTQFPDLDGTVPPSVEAADFPALLPLEPLMARAAPIVSDPVETANTLERRIAALRARARALQRRDIVDPATRARMQARLG